MKRISVLIALISQLAFSQNIYNVHLKKSGINFSIGPGSEGFNLDLPDDYRVYMYGEKVLLGVERFDHISEFEKVKDTLYVKYVRKMTAIMNSEGDSSADSNFVYEIDDSPMFDIVRVKYYFYRESFGSNSLGNGWISIGEGSHEFIVVSGDWVVYRFTFMVSGGKLILPEKPKRMEKLSID